VENVTEEENRLEITDETAEMKREQEYNLIGFSTVRESLANVPFRGGELIVAEEIAKSVMNTTLAEYFSANEGHYLDPELRKYIIAGATMAYVYWHSGIEADSGRQAYE
jgi:hypothetical protein